MKDIPENKIQRAAAEALGLDAFDEAVFAEEVTLITVPGDFALVFHLADGTQVKMTWEATSKKDCWTPEARQAAAERMRKRVYSEEERKSRSEQAKKRWAENPNWNGRRKP